MGPRPVTIWHVDAVLGAFLAWQFLRDRFALLNRTADWIEDNVFPPALRYSAIGDPASWLDHTFVALCLATAWGGLAALLGIGFGVGFFHGAVAMMAFYIVREANSAIGSIKADGWSEAVRVRPFRKGWLVGWGLDGLLDLIGPALILWSAWRI